MYIYILCILYVTYTYMTSKSLKDVTVLEVETPSVSV